MLAYTCGRSGKGTKVRRCSSSTNGVVWCHVPCLYTVMGWGVMSRVCIPWWGGVSCPMSVYRDGVSCAVSVYRDGVGCHVQCLCTVMGWGVMSHVCIPWWGGVLCAVSVYCDGVGCHVLCLYTVTGWGFVPCVYTVMGWGHVLSVYYNAVWCHACIYNMVFQCGSTTVKVALLQAGTVTIWPQMFMKIYLYIYIVAGRGEVWVVCILSSWEHENTQKCDYCLV